MTSTPKLPLPSPLTWPDAWKRTEYSRRQLSAYKTQNTQALDSLERELRLFVGTSPRQFVITCNWMIGIQGKLLTSKGEPQDPGVAVWWLDPRTRELRVLACDKWKTVRENMRAIQQSVAALRTLERAGASQILERAVASFSARALPSDASPTSYADGSANARPWWATVLNVATPCSRADVDQAFRELSKTKHPDRGGDSAQWLELQRAHRAAREAFDQHQQHYGGAAAGA